VPPVAPVRRVSHGALTTLLIVGGGAAGVVVGLSAAAFGLALVGQPLLGLEPARVQVALTAGPLLGLMPMAVLAYAAGRSRDVARRAPAAFGVWLAMGAATMVWFGLLPLLR
jgi:hypothetical protein